MLKRSWTGLEKQSNALGFGCWQIAGNHDTNGVPNGWGEVDDEEAIDLLSSAMENGIDFYDTAQGYNFGHSEKLLGTAIRRTKKEVIVCTKIALTENEVAQKKIGIDFRNRVFQSMDNLGLTQIDILLIHNPPDDLDWQSFDLDVIHQLIELKWIGTYGVSSRGLKGAINAIENNVGTTLEWVFNIFEKRPIKDLFPMIRAKKLNFIARSPLSRGLINPNYIHSYPKFDSRDFRTTLPDDWVQWVVHSLRDMHRSGIAVEDLVKSALLFCSNQRTVNATIVGIKSKNQLDQFLAIACNTEYQLDLEKLSRTPEFYPKWAL